MKGLVFRPSACGLYVVSLMGELPRVLTISEAEAVRDLYLDKEQQLEAQGKEVLAEHERAGASALDAVLLQAFELRSTIQKRGR